MFASAAASSAAAQVPSCCVLTSLGLSLLPGSTPGGREFGSALQQLLQRLRTSSLQLLGNGTFRVEEAAGEIPVAQRHKDVIRSAVCACECAVALVHLMQMLRTSSLQLLESETFRVEEAAGETQTTTKACWVVPLVLAGSAETCSSCCSCCRPAAAAAHAADLQPAAAWEWDL
jgi:predicted nucleic acid-binding protein